MNINSIYSLRDLKRYNNTPRIKEESVAEHTAFVALIVLNLEDKYRFDVDKAIKMALVHDLSEIYITDIPHNVKHRFPKMQKEIKKAELDVFENNFPNYVEYYKELELGKSIEAKIVYYADVLSCKQYSESEVKLGNTGYMIKVLEESKERLKEIEKELKEFRK